MKKDKTTYAELEKKVLELEKFIEKNHVVDSNKLTILKTTEDALIQEQVFSNSFLDSLPGIFYLFTYPELRLVRWNKNHEILLGFGPEELKYRTVLDWLRPEAKEMVLKALAHTMETGQLLIESDLFAKDGRSIPFILSGVKLDMGQKYIMGAGFDISEHRRTEETLKETNAYLENLINCANAPIMVWDPQFRITRFNHAFEFLTGRSEKEVLGQSLEMLFPSESAEQSMVLIRKTLTGERWETVEIEILHRDESIRTVLWNSATLFAPDSHTPIATIAQGQDITDRKHAEIKLREKEMQYRNLADSGAALIWTSGTDKLCNYFNEPWLNFTGRRLEQELGDGWKEGVHPDDRDHCIKTYLNAFDKQESYNMEYRLRHVSGEYRWLLDKGIPNYNIRREFIGYIGHCFEISELKQAELEIKHKNEELQKLNVEKDKFFSIIAHDLRSPFNSFLGYTELMVEELYSMSLKDIQEMAVDMKRSAYNLFNLLENLLEWSRIQRGLTSYTPKQFPLMNKITECMQSILESAEKKRIEVSIHIPKNLKVFADANMLESTIRNLAANAVKFTPKGGEILLEAKLRNDNMVEISICDNGIGMDNTMLDKLFHLDEQINRRGTEGEATTGLGLIICKDFVEKNGGELWAESEEGKGSTFYFTIPLNS